MRKRRGWGGGQAENEGGEKPQSIYLFAVSAVVAVVGVDSCPWRYGEQHFSRRYVRSGELNPGCQLTSAAGEVRAWSPAARLRVVLLLLLKVLLLQDGAPLLALRPLQGSCAPTPLGVLTEEAFTSEVCLRLFIHWHSRTHSDIVSLSRTAVRPDQLYSDNMNIVWISTGLLLRNPAPTPPP
ncbi:hypothetical protein XENOCAPTIV_002943 [Xenoophorus captivus]|uniref:Uncharacterized protein n=1 Tax=Xenoophorus captivus TaxID=1517983 RepID=A0ABV0QCK5_9TELE